MFMNLNNPAEGYPQLSPLFDHMQRDSPYLSPLPNSALLKYEESEDDFMHFELEPHSEIEPLPGLDTPEEECPSLDEQPYLEVKIEESQSLLREEPEKAIDLYSTRFLEGKEEAPPTCPRLGLSQSCSQVQTLIEFLVERSSQEQRFLLSEAQTIYENNESLREAFLTLLVKFKKLRKTKEEMTKYCMRKAFKFIADKMKKDRNHSRDVDSCMKLYFSRSQNGTNFTIPFKKNSLEKTMNGNFLKRVFGSPAFVDDYREFLKDFKVLMEEDNDRKIKYLAQMMEKYLAGNQTKKIQSIKRLPWTRQTLNQTEELGISLLDYAQGGSKRDKIKQQ